MTQYSGEKAQAADLSATVGLDAKPAHEMARRRADPKKKSPLNGAGQDADAAVAPERPDPGVTLLTEADLKRIGEMLSSGGTAVARRGDIGELHNRIVTLFGTLKDGLGAIHSEKAEQDRTAIVARLDEIDEAVNRMEGALRIEFEPLLRASIEDAVARQFKPATRRYRSVLLAGVFLIVGLAIGASFDVPLRSMSDRVMGKVVSTFAPGGSNLSPNGGVENSEKSIN